MRPLACALLALVFAAPAAAHTDQTRQLSFAWPASGTVTSPFGRDGARWHPGIDIGTLRSLEVTAAAPGVVRRAGWQPGYEGYGLIVETDLGGGYSALYAHLAAASVHRGEYVTEGMHLGTAGCTGWCTGTHLHFELRLRGTAIDPTPLLDRG